MTNASTTIDHALDRAQPPKILKEIGTASKRPYALIARDGMNYENVFVTELLEDRIVLRAGPSGYTILFRDEDHWISPSDRSVNCRSVGTVGGVLTEVQSAAELLKQPLSVDEIASIRAKAELLPKHGTSAHQALRVSIGREPRVDVWMHPEFTTALRMQLRGI